MTYEERLERLIRAGWRVIDSNFDESAYLQWRKESAKCLAEMFGPDHFYYLQFTNKVRARNPQNILIGDGILVAARELDKGSQESQGKVLGATNTKS